MSGTLDFEEQIIYCPECGSPEHILMCEDYDPDEEPSLVVGIAGGTHECSECGYLIVDEDLDEDLYYGA